ncbi:hypothetical protein MMC25_007262 [Agyrium rufum]|nr:hypothetical protein [Agyrium rufum]
MFSFGQWLEGIGLTEDTSPTITAGAESRSLSVTRVPDSEGDTYLLFVGGTSGMVSAWSFNYPSGTDTSSNIWTNVTDQISDPSTPGAPRYAPFAGGTVDTGEGSNGTEATVEFALISMNGSAPWLGSVEYTNQINGSFGFQPALYPTYKPVPELYNSNNDLAQCTFISEGNDTQAMSVYFWVSGTSLTEVTPFGAPLPLPPLHSSFPFKRLAASSYDISGNMFVYHQINASAFAEEVLNFERGGWTSANVTVSTT